MNEGRGRALSRVFLGLGFVAAGSAHFIVPDFYLRMMPPYLPAPAALVFVSGLCEVGLGILSFVTRYRVLTRRSLVALLLAVFPANLHMAINSDQFNEFSSAGLWARLPVQALLILWVCYAFSSCASTHNIQGRA